MADRTLRESFTCDRSVTVDRDAGLIKGVKLLGEKGNCDYPQATRAKAISLLEGRRIYTDHAPRGSKEPRSYRDALGVTQNVREGTDGLYGDVKYNPKHPLAEQLAWDAENAPHLLGFSITGDGDKRRERGRVIVEAITRIDSCDLVTSPAHGGGLFEGRTVPKKISELIESLKAKRPGYARGLSRLLREEDDPMSGIMSPDDTMAEPVEAEPESESKDHEQALLDAAKAVLDDTALSSADKLAKIKGILKLVDGGGASASTDSASDTTTEESRRKNQGNLREALEIEALKQLGRKGIRLTPLVEKAIAGCKDQAEVTELIESLNADAAPAGPQTFGRQQPRSSTPTSEQGTPLRESKEQKQTSDEERQRRLREMRLKR